MSTNQFLVRQLAMGLEVQNILVCLKYQKNLGRILELFVINEVYFYWRNRVTSDSIVNFVNH